MKDYLYEYGIMLPFFLFFFLLLLSWSKYNVWPSQEAAGLSALSF